jgi:hypothetical protein
LYPPTGRHRRRRQSPGQPDRRQLYECEGGTTEVLEILGQPTAAVEPGQGPFHDPPPWQNLKASRSKPLNKRFNRLLQLRERDAGIAKQSELNGKADAIGIPAMAC